MPRNSICFDVCIVGAGVAGLAAAHKFRCADASVALLSAAHGTNTFKHGDYLPAAAARILRDLRLESLYQENAIPDYSGIQSSWETDELVSTDFAPNSNERGWLLDRFSFEKSFQASVQRQGAALFCGRIKGVKRKTKGWQVEGGEIAINANWVIDATGRAAHFATGQGAIRHEDSSQFAVVRWFQAPPQDGSGSPVVEAVRGGWWYTAVLPNDIRVITFQGERSAVAPMYRSLPHWISCLNQSKHVVSKICLSRELTRPKLLQASGSYLAPAGGENWLAVGDAALAFDPISSQGIFSALYTGLRAAEAVLGGAGVEEYLNRLCLIREAYLRNVSKVYGQLKVSEALLDLEPPLCTRE